MGVLTGGRIRQNTRLTSRPATNTQKLDLTMNKPTAPFIALLAVVLIGCQSLYTGTVTLTKAVDSAAQSYADLYNRGLVPPDIALKASLAHAEYRKSAGLAHDALVAYKLGQTADFKTALEAARVAANNFVDILVPLLSKEQGTKFRSQIANATQP